jgi:hypothetical protein
VGQGNVYALATGAYHRDSIPLSGQGNGNGLPNAAASSGNNGNLCRLTVKITHLEIRLGSPLVGVFIVRRLELAYRSEPAKHGSFYDLGFCI